MTPYPGWMRNALFATAGMNLAAAGAFLPGADGLREMVGFPPGGHPFYLLTAGMFVAIFGVGYLAAALSPRPERMYVALAAAGKTSFVAMVAAFWLAGVVPLRGLVLASADLVFAALFLYWLRSDRAHEIESARRVA